MQGLMYKVSTVALYIIASVSIFSNTIIHCLDHIIFFSVSPIIMPQTRSGRRTTLPSKEALGNRKQAQVTNPPLYWERIPSIVQEGILRELAEDYNRHSLEDKRHRAAYAAVSLQWQIFFERLNFHKLVLHPSALKDFETIIKRRLHYKNSGKKGCQRQRTAAKAFLPVSRMPQIHHIWLCIELLPYNCNKCKLPEDTREVVQ